MFKKANIADEELVKAAQDGSLEAFTTLYDRYLPLVYNRVRYTIPYADIEDITQEVFMAVLKSLRSFRGEAQFSTWLRTLTNREVADYYRNRKNNLERSHLPLDEPDSTENLQAEAQQARGDVYKAVDEGLLLQEAIHRLPGHYQEIIFYRFAEGLSFEEIAQCQGQSLEATKSLFRRVIATLQKQLEPTDG